MPISKSEREFHRKTAARCFNTAWDYLVKKGRRSDDDQQMLHLAHASRFHWSIVGSPRNQAVGDWQISRVYAALNQPQLALLFAQSCLTRCRKGHLEYILCTAYEAVARAHAVAGDYASAREHIRKAHQALDASSVNATDRRIFLGQIRETEGLIGR
jgi:hypothetical protein